jgi:Glycosyltransferase family 10 (fucosyltransferase) C-term
LSLDHEGGAKKGGTPNEIISESFNSASVRLVHFNAPLSFSSSTAKAATETKRMRPRISAVLGVVLVLWAIALFAVIRRPSSASPNRNKNVYDESVAQRLRERELWRGGEGDEGRDVLEFERSVGRTRPPLPASWGGGGGRARKIGDETDPSRPSETSKPAPPVPAPAEKPPVGPAERRGETVDDPESAAQAKAEDESAPRIPNNPLAGEDEDGLGPEIDPPVLPERPKNPEYEPWHARMARAVDDYADAREKRDGLEKGAFRFKLEDIKALEKLPALEWRISKPVVVQVGCRIAYSHAMFDSAAWMCPKNCTIKRAPVPGKFPNAGLARGLSTNVKTKAKRMDDAFLSLASPASTARSVDPEFREAFELAKNHTPADMIFDWDCCRAQNTYRETPTQLYGSMCQEAQASSGRIWWQTPNHLSADIRGSYRLDEDVPMTYTEWYQVPDGWTLADDDKGRQDAAVKVRKAKELSQNPSSTPDDKHLSWLGDLAEKFREPTQYDGMVRTWSDYMRPMFAPAKDIARKRSFVRNSTNPAEQGLVLFVHGNCASKTKREMWVKGLSGFHARGRCLKNAEAVVAEEGEHRDSAKVRMASEYKFLASLENTEAPWYVTEKSFEAYLAGAVPIILGDKYSKYFTPDEHSAIKVRDFGTPEQLNDFLVNLDRDDEAYMKFHAFRQRGVTRSFVKVMFYSWMTVGCQMCEMAAHDYKSTLPATRHPPVEK